MRAFVLLSDRFAVFTLDQSVVDRFIFDAVSEYALSLSSSFCCSLVKLL